MKYAKSTYFGAMLRKEPKAPILATNNLTSEPRRSIDYLLMMMKLRESFHLNSEHAGRTSTASIEWTLVSPVDLS